MQRWELTGTVATGVGQGQGFTRLDWVREAFIAAAGIEPYAGTLNLRLDSPEARATWTGLRATPGALIPGQQGACDARCYPVLAAAQVPAAIVLPEVPDYPDDQVELVAAVNLREQLGLADGDALTIGSAGTRGLAAAVFDVDGTLVNSVDAYHIAAGRAAEPMGYAVTRDMVRQALNAQTNFWELVIGDEAARSDALVAELRRETMRHWNDILHEHVTVFPGLPDTLTRLRAAGLRLAIYTGSQGESFAPLEAAGLLEWFEIVLTRADVDQLKPHPEGVLRCLDHLGVGAGEAAYIGDAVQDMHAARAAGALAVGMLTGAADSAALSAAGAHRLAADHRALIDILLAE